MIQFSLSLWRTGAEKANLNRVDFLGSLDLLRAHFPNGTRYRAAIPASHCACDYRNRYPPPFCGFHLADSLDNSHHRDGSLRMLAAPLPAAGFPAWTYWEHFRFPILLALAWGYRGWDATAPIRRRGITGVGCTQVNRCNPIGS